MSNELGPHIYYNQDEISGGHKKEDDEKIDLKNIELRIDEFAQELEKIAKFFGINPEQFGSEDDQLIIEKVRNLSNHPSEAAIEGNFLFDRFDYFDSARNKKSRYMGPESTTRSLFQTKTKFEEIGSMQMIEGNSIQEIRPPFFTQQECSEALKIPSTEIMQTTNQQIIIAHLKESPDQDIQSFLSFIQNSSNNDEPPLWNNFYCYVTENNMVEGNVAKLKSKIIACEDNISFPDSYQKLVTDLGRLQMHLSILTIQRYWYFDKLARSGKSEAIREDTTKQGVAKFFNVDSSFTLTQEDIDLAKEADLPWTEIE